MVLCGGAWLKILQMSVLSECKRVCAWQACVQDVGDGTEEREVKNGSREKMDSWVARQEKEEEREVPGEVTGIRNENKCHAQVLHG